MRRPFTEWIAADVRYALRTFRASPGFVATAVLSLALGIGANTAIFTVTGAVFRSALPVREPSRLLEVYWVDRGSERTDTRSRVNLSYLNFQDLRDRNDVFESMACFASWTLTLGRQASGHARSISVTMASANYFDVLGVQPVLGRLFRPGEDMHVGGDRVAVLSHLAWTTLFAEDPAVVGKTVVLHNMPFTVIGVAPPGFKGTMTLLDPEQIWIPVSMWNIGSATPETDALLLRRNRQVRAFGRLKNGIEPQAALASVQGVARALEQEYPWENTGGSFEVEPLADAALDSMPTANADRIAAALSAAVALVLLIACLNVANLLMIRASARSRDIAVRAAIGASRWQLARQLVVEGLLLAVAGGVTGLVVGIVGANVLWALRPEYVTRGGLDLQIDWQVLLFTAGAALVAHVVFALAPAVYASTPNLAQLMNTGRRSGGPAGGHASRHLLVIGQVAVASVALIFASLLIRSLQHAQAVDLGFEGANLGVVNFDLSARAAPPDNAPRFIESILTRATAVPGVTAVALATATPLSGMNARTLLSEEQKGDPTNRGTITPLNYVSHDFFRTMGMRPITGRLFDRFDRAGAKRVAVINEAMAEYFWPGQDPVGKRFLLRSVPKVLHEVVGVVRNTVIADLDAKTQPVGYIPLEQELLPRLSLHIRTTGDAARVVPAVMAEVQSLDPGLALTDATTIDRLLASRLWAWRAGASLFALFGLLGLALTAVGIFGALTHTVAVRTNEIGIRIAIGASAHDMRLSIVLNGLRLVAAGVAVGAAAAFALSAIVRSLLFGVEVTDWIAFTMTAATLAAVGAAACWIAGRRILGINPLRAISHT